MNLKKNTKLIKLIVKLSKQPVNNIHDSKPDFQEIPTLDLQELNSNQSNQCPKKRAQLVDNLRQAGTKVGFFQIVNHGISSDLIENIWKQQQNFFQLDKQEKMKVHISNGVDLSGYSYLGEEITLGKKDMKETIEYFDINYDSNNKQQFMESFKQKYPLYHKYFLSSPKYPKQYPEFEKTVTQYRAEINKLGHNIMGLFAETMFLPNNYFKENDLLNNNFSIIRMNKYPPKEKVVQSESQNNNNISSGIGIGAHVDPGWLGILNQDSIGGLQVLNSAGSWIDAIPNSKALVVNIGETMQHFTRGFYRATPHRVLNNTSKEKKTRYSNVVFFEPNINAKIKPIEYLSDDLDQFKVQHYDYKQNPDIARSQFLTQDNVVYGQMVLDQYYRGYPHKFEEDLSIQQQHIQQ